MEPDIVVVGSCMTDLISYVPRLPIPGETLHGDLFLMGFGGKGANQCIAAAKLGAKTAMVAKVGEDVFGNNYIKNFKDHSVNHDYVFKTSEHSTGMASISVSNDGSNSIVIVAGANLHLMEEEISLAESMISKSKVVVCQLEIDQKSTIAALRLAKKHGVTTILNPAPVGLSFDAQHFQYADIICPNEVEAEMLTGLSVKSPEEAVDAAVHLLKLGPDVVIITLGSMGCVYASKDNPVPKHILAESVDAVDTTGAGDAFVGTLAFCIVKECQNYKSSISDIVSKALYVATVSVKHKGTQDSYPWLADLPHKLSKYFDH